MKLIVGFILSLALLELFHCAPLIGSEEGTYTEAHTSNSWGYNAGLDVNTGLEGGFKDGHATLGAKKHVGVNVGGHKENDQMYHNHAAAATPPPNNVGSGFGYPNGMPNNLANGSPYYIQNAPLPPPQYQQFVPQFAPQSPQYAPQYVPQYAYAPQYAPQTAPQYAPQTAPQYALQYVPQGAPQNTLQYVPQGAPQYTLQYAPQSAPQYASQGAPHYVNRMKVRTVRSEQSVKKTYNKLVSGYQTPAR